ncbi:MULTISPECIES: MFS transporter [Brevundimonas]|uniref:MFS transporter n=1 Tax=Brevundimonas TaxID=41275 RepID=UPI0006276D44|nr:MULTISPECIES: MFS transporter [Brevundimonas]
MTDIPNDAPPGWSTLLSGRNGVYALVLAGGVVLHSVNIYIATTVMPSAVQDIGGLDFYAWTTTLFVLASILAAAVTAPFLRATGPRAAYAAAALIFAGGSLICALAPSMPVMLGGRFIQGFGGGLLYALAYAVTRIVFLEALWGRVISVISAMFGVATLIGPAIGGLFAEMDAWRLAFGSLIPVAGLFILLALTALPGRDGAREGGGRLPLFQLLLLSGAVLSVSAGSLSPLLAWNLAGLGAAVALVVLIAVVDGRSQARLLPRRSFSLKTPLGVLYLTIALLMAGMQAETFVPYLLQTLHAQSPLWAGYLAALMAFGWTFATLASSRWQGGSGTRLLLAGPLLMLGGLILMSVFLPIETAGGAGVLAGVCLGLFLVGFGIGLVWPALVTRVFQNAPDDERGLTSGAMTTVQLFAIAMGAAGAGMIANVAGIATPGGVEGAASAAFWLSALFAAAPILVLLLTPQLLRLTAVRRS